MKKITNNSNSAWPVQVLLQCFQDCLLLSTEEKSFYSTVFKAIDADQVMIMVEQIKENLQFPDTNETFPQAFLRSIHRLSFLSSLSFSNQQMIQSVLFFSEDELFQMKRKSKELKNDLLLIYN